MPWIPPLKVDKLFKTQTSFFYDFCERFGNTVLIVVCCLLFVVCCLLFVVCLLLHSLLKNSLLLMVI